MVSDQAARERLRELFVAHGEQVLLYFKRRTDVDSAREGVADTFLVAWRRIDDIPVESEVPWLYGVARRVLSQQRRARSRRTRLLLKLSGVAPSDVPAPETMVVRNAELAEVLAGVDRLSSRDREILRLAVWDELPHADIATILGCSPHAVDQRLYRATKKLARELQSSGHKPHERPIRMPEPGKEGP